MANSNPSKKRKRQDPDEESSHDDDTSVLITPRHNEFTKETWWEVDLESSNTQGATALVLRCMREYGWNLERTKDILKAYRQFLTLKQELKDWDAQILSPSYFVDQMWHQHIMDIGNYYHDMIMLCGRVVLHDPDGASNSEAKKIRDDRTRLELVQKFGMEQIDFEIWGYPCKFKRLRDRANGIDDGRVLLYIECQQSKHQYRFMIQRTTRMINVFNKYAGHAGLDRTHLRFLFKGDVRIRENQTAEELGLMDGDKIDAIQSERAVSGPIVLKFTDQLQHEVYFKIPSTLKMRKAFKIYAKRYQLQRDQLRFMFRGVLVRDDDTPEYHDMEDNCRIDVEMARGGC